MSTGNDDFDERGWMAITDTFSRHYGDSQDSHVGYVPGLRFGSPLQGCSARREQDHCVYVTYGLTERCAV